MSADPPPGPFRNVDGAAIRRRYRALARSVRDREAARFGDAVAWAIEHAPAGGSCGRPRGSGASVADRRPAAAGGSPSAGPPPDEVVIDFPSMAPIVARMRDAFLAAAGDFGADIRRADVALTAGQAGRGIRVPLDLTVRQTCPACGGRGESWADPCGLCGGSGAGLLPHRLHVRVPPGVRHGTRLRYSVTPPNAFETHIEVRIAVP